MEYRYLGDTGLQVSKLCLGTLTMTKSQGNLSKEESALLIKDAFEEGINFLDTAELYDNYDQIAGAFKYVKRDDLVITSKTYAYNKELAQKSVKNYLDQLKTDYADIFLLHEQESLLTLRGHYEALEELQRLKEKGYIKAIGLSTHKIAAVKASRDFAEIDVVHPMINIEGLGILDGSRDQMLKEIKGCHDMGIGIYAMKVLGGGHLISKADQAIKWINNIDYIDSIAIGMQSKAEIIANAALINNEEIPEDVNNNLRNTNRTISVEEYCVGCGRCMEKCRHKAIEIINGQAKINMDKCILCGYCASVCPDFYIKVY